MNISKDFTILERFTAEKYPSSLKAILIASAYNSFASLRRLNSESIREIEEFISANRNLIIDTVYQNMYQNQEPFKFLPGHKAILLGIPDQIKELDRIKNEKKQNKKSMEKPNRAQVSEGDLKNQLAFNLVNYYSKNNCPLPENVLTTRNLVEFKRHPNDVDACCRFVCPFCPKVLPVSYREHWRSGNLTTHLREHVEKEKERMEKMLAAQVAEHH